MNIAPVNSIATNSQRVKAQLKNSNCQPSFGFAMKKVANPKVESAIAKNGLPVIAAILSIFGINKLTKTEQKDQLDIAPVKPRQKNVKKSVRKTSHADLNYQAKLQRRGFNKPQSKLKRLREDQARIAFEELMEILSNLENGSR